MLLTSKEVAEKAGVSVRTIHAYRRDGRLPDPVRTDPYMYDEDAIDQWLADRPGRGARTDRPTRTPVELEREWLAEKYNAHTAEEVAGMAGVSVHTIYAHLRYHGIPLRGHLSAPDWAEILTAEALEQYAARGYTANALAKELKCTRRTIIRHAVRHDVGALIPPISEERQSRLHRDYVERGMSGSQIAEEWGMSLPHIQHLLRVAGIDSRPRGGAR